MQSSYRPDIDGLRAVAVGSVVIFHAFPEYLPGGFVGVDIFFVISGFLITSIIIDEVQNGTFRFVDFYARRARRIFPALIAVLVAALIAGWLLLLADEYRSLGKHSATGAGFLANIGYYLESGYFDASAKFKPLLHLWSLGVEEQFYLLWPLLLFFTRTPRALAVLIGLASLTYCFYLTPRNSYAAFFLPFTRFWELMAGAALASAVFGKAVSHWTTHRYARDATSLVGVVLIAIGLLFSSENAMFPAPMALFPVAGAAILIAAGPHATFNRFVLGNRLAVAIGLISYPLYLWHWPLLSFPAIIEGSEASADIRIAAVAASVALAAATYFAIEKPIRSGRALYPKAIALSTALVLAAAAGTAVYLTQGIPNRSAVIVAPNAAQQLDSALWRYTSNKDCTSRYSPTDAERYGWWFCYLSKPEAPTVMIVGSSFANHLYPGIANHPAMDGETILSIGSCAPEWIHESEVKPTTDELSPCTMARRLDQQRVINAIAKDARPKLVILSGLSERPDEDYVERIRRRVSFFEKHGAKVVVVLPHLTAEFNLSACFGRRLRPGPKSCDIPYSHAKIMHDNQKPLVDGLMATNPHVDIFEINQVFCRDTTCSFIKDQLPLFRDQYSHFSEFGSAAVAKLLLTQVSLPQQP